MKEMLSPSPQSHHEVEKIDWSPPRIKKLPAPETLAGMGFGGDGFMETSRVQDVTG